jgi:DNA-directed RNA polymerase subunit M/transcription elongation factor TFIIS
MSGAKKKTASKGNISNRVVAGGKAKPKTSVPKKPSKRIEIEEEKYNDANHELYDLYPSTKADIEPTPTLLALLINNNLILSSKLEEEYVRIPFDPKILTSKSLGFDTDQLNQIMSELGDNKLNIVNLDATLEKLGIEPLSIDDITSIRKKLTRVEVSILEASPELQEAIDETYPNHEEEIIGLAHNIGDEETITILNENYDNNVDFDTWYWRLPIFDKYLEERKLKSEYYRNDQIVKVGIATCPRCHGENTLGGTRQAGAGDEGFESRYTCLDCQFTWKGGRYH